MVAMLFRAVFVLCCFSFLAACPLTAQSPILQKLDSMERALATIADPLEKTKQMNDLAFAYLNVNTSKTLEYAHKTLASAQKNNFVALIAKAHNLFALYYANTSQIEKAFVHYDSSLMYNRQANSEVGVARVSNNIGILHYRLGNYDKALEYTFEALKSFEKLEDHASMIRALTGVANIYMEQRLYDKAIHYSTLALQKCKAIGDNSGAALALGNLANVHTNMESFQKAKDAYTEALAIYRELGDLQGIGINLMNLATIWDKEGNHKIAQEMLSEARQMFLKTNNPRHIAATTGYLGDSYFLSYEDFDKKGVTLVPGSRNTLLRSAILYLKEGVKLTQATNHLKLVEYFSLKLYKAYEAAKRPDQALHYYKIHVSAKDSLFSLESKKQIEKLTTEREVELKNKQIELDRLAVEKKRNERAYFGAGMALLLLSLAFIYRNYANQKKSNTQLGRLNQQIAASNEELTDKNLQLTQTMRTLEETQGQLIESEKQKENALIRSRISQDIHDDISAGLNKISWLAEAVAAKASRPDAPLDLGTIQRINDYSRETVSKLGEIIWSSNPERDNLPSLLEYIRRYAENYLDDSAIRCQFDFPDALPNLELNPELRRNLYLVTKEALHNARKYSGADVIRLSFSLSPEQEYRLEVRDNGRGMEPDQVKGGGNGLRNMRRRMEAVGGQVSIESALGKGTALVFYGNVANT